MLAEVSWSPGKYGVTVCSKWQRENTERRRKWTPCIESGLRKAKHGWSGRAVRKWKPVDCSKERNDVIGFFFL